MINQKNISIKDFSYNLPDEKIASHPLKQRDNCKLLVYKNQEISQDIFKNIKNYLEKDTLLIVNDTKVIQARMEFFNPNGARIEIFCLEPEFPKEYDSNFSQTQKVVWKCLIGNQKRWKDFDLTKKLVLNNQEITLVAKKNQVGEGEALIEFSWDKSVSFAEIISLAGQIPIPPYLKRKAEADDSVDYQTVYSNFKGSVAAPTAGLHFTQELLENLGVERDNVTLHVGAGTFKPVKSLTIGEHEMHKEYFLVDRRVIQKIIKHKGHITAVGTTSVRTLESLYWQGVRLIQGEFSDTLSQWDCYSLNQEISLEDSMNALLNYMNKNQIDTFKSSTGIIICPGYQYRVVDNLITNFHQPQSTLLLLVSAAVGLKWKEIYDYALNNDFRFLSYGDGSFLQITNKANL